MTHQASMLHSMQTRTAVLEQEKHELQDLNEQLQAEINSLRRLASIKDTGQWLFSTRNLRECLHMRPPLSKKSFPVCQVGKKNRLVGRLGFFFS